MKHPLPLFYYDDGCEGDVHWVRIDGDGITQDDVLEAFADRLGHCTVLDAGTLAFSDQIAAARSLLGQEVRTVVHAVHEVTFFTLDPQVRQALIGDITRCLPG